MDLIGLKSEFVKDYIDKIISNPTVEYKSKADIARALNIKPQYLNAILSNKRNVSDPFFKKFISVFNVNQIDLDDLFSKEKAYFPTVCNEPPVVYKCAHCLEKDKLISKLEHIVERYEKEIDWLREQINQGQDKSKRNSA